jgi:hypothetical protein
MLQVDKFKSVIYKHSAINVIYIVKITWETNEAETNEAETNFVLSESWKSRLIYKVRLQF